jgi:hypothetical protein
MSVYLNAIDAFIFVIESHENLSANEKILSDLKKFADNLPEDNDEIVDNIIQIWLKADESRNDLFRAYQAQLKTQPSTIDYYDKAYMFGHDDVDEEEQSKILKSGKEKLHNSIYRLCDHTVKKDQNAEPK